MTPIVRTVADLRALARGWKARGETVGVVPTMGALHDGHLSLAHRARAECDRVITTIFVNPKQFNNPEDLKKYPRSEEADAALLATVPVDAIFAPPVEEVYPDGFITTVSMQGVAQPLEGYMRPGHFDGVATVVTRLFNAVQPDVVVLGSKDYQQLQTIRHLVRDLAMPIEIVAAPTRREADGLAMSSRNQYLDAAQRQQATLIHRTLLAMKQGVANGRAFADIEREADAALRAGGFVPDYAELRRAEDLKRPAPDERRGLVALIAARLGRTRLIDNLELDA